MANENEGFQEELKLARKMKDECCRASVGKQLKETNPEKAAEILRKIGLIYRQRSSDKISLIKCVGLLNAAIVRNPSNVSQIKSDLSNACLHILLKSGATNQRADLISKAKEVKTSFEKMRNEVIEFLDFSKKILSNDENLKKLITTKIGAIRYLNLEIAMKYKEIMAKLCLFCQEVMGSPSCEYAIVGMGSLARNEITTYSDFEHIILLCDQNNYQLHLEYFRWLSVIFHTVILNLQETIIASLDIKSLNDKHSELGDWYFDAHTPRGVSFDGMMPHACKFPLGRTEPTPNKPFPTELIKPVSEMLEYLSSEADLKNGYHLADILTRTCFVFGNKRIFEKFEKGVQNYSSLKSNQQRIEEVSEQVKDDLENFSSRYCLANLKSQTSINIKQLVYRSSTLFIAALGRIHNISAKSCSDVIDELTNNKIITRKTWRKLRYAIAIACEFRLRVYTKYKSQCDHVSGFSIESENVQNFLDIVGAPCTISYFQIAYCLQCEVAKQVNFQKRHYYSDPQLFNITLGLAFGIDKLKEHFAEDHSNKAGKLSEFDFDECLKRLERFCDVDSAMVITDLITDSMRMKYLANYLYSQKLYAEAMDFYLHLLVYYKNISRNETTDINIAITLFTMGHCTYNIGDFNAALKNYNEALKIHQTIPAKEKKERNIAELNLGIGRCLHSIQQDDSALTHLKASLEIYQNVSLDLGKDIDIAGTLNDIGACFVNLHQYEDALIHSKQALEIYKNASPDLGKDRNIAVTLENIGLCLQNLCQFDKAMLYQKKALEIFKNASPDQSKDSNVAVTLNNVGNCLLNLCQFDKALIYYKQALEIHKNASPDQSKDINVAATHHSISLCLGNLHEYDDALIHSKQALEIHKNATLDQSKDKNVVGALHNIGLCLGNLRQFDEALIYFRQALEISKKASPDQSNDSNVAATLSNIGLCLLNLHQYDEALIYSKQALEIHENASPDQSKDRNVADTLDNISLCLQHLDQYDDALIYFKQALEIRKNASPDHSKDSIVAGTLDNISLCLRNLHQYDEAVIYCKQTLEIYKSTSSDQSQDINVAATLHNIGLCLKNLRQFDKALIYHRQALEIHKNASPDQSKDSNVSDVLLNIGSCFLNLHQYDEALVCYKQALAIYKNASSDLSKDRNIAQTLYNIGLCLKNLHQYEDALIYFKDALKIHKNASPDHSKDRNVAVTLYNIGSCFLSLHQYDEALCYYKQALEIRKNASPDQSKDRNVAEILITLICVF